MLTAPTSPSAQAAQVSETLQESQAGGREGRALHPGIRQLPTQPPLSQAEVRLCCLQPDLEVGCPGEPGFCRRERSWSPVQAGQISWQRILFPIPCLGGVGSKWICTN